MLKIAQISDLHFCASPLRDMLPGMFQSLGLLLGHDFRFELADEKTLTTVRLLVEEVNPDVICATGDITAFGDRSSFEELSEFFQEICARRGGERKLFISPGNHDVLCSQLAGLLNEGDWRRRAARRLLLADVYGRAQSILRMSEVGLNIHDPLSNFNHLKLETGAESGDAPVGLIEGVPVYCVPTTGLIPGSLWTSLGSLDEDADLLFSRIREGAPALRIAITHTNPMSNPDNTDPGIFRAYNNAATSSSFARELQRAGVDLVLHGGQHQFSCCLVDFIPEQPGHIYLVGAPSATCGHTRGLNLVEITSRFEARVHLYPISTAGRFAPAQRTDNSYRLVFENSRVEDPLTITARSEIRRYQYKNDSDSEWDQMYMPGATDVLVVGPRHRRVAVRNRQIQLINMIEHPDNHSFRVLVTDPSLFDRIERLPPTDAEYLSRMWGRTDYSWASQANLAKGVIEAMREIYRSLPGRLKNKLEVRVSHTFIPVGGVCRNLKGLNALILIHLLPFGLMGDLDKPLLKLEKRHDDAVFCFYRDYLELLWDEANEVPLD